MAVTLAQARLNVTDDLQAGIIDEFAKSSFILNNIPFHDCVSPVGGGATLTYGYTRLVTQPQAEFRKVNAEYGTHEVEKQRYVTELKVFGGAYEVDRLIADMGGIADEVALQASQKVKAASALFSDTIIPMPAADLFSRTSLKRNFLKPKKARHHSLLLQRLIFPAAVSNIRSALFRPKI